MEYKLSNFEGPLDLLLYMLSKNKIEIKDIFVSNIIDQFLEVIEKSEDKNLGEMSEFVYISSRLLYIKSKKLLPILKEEAEILEEEFIVEVFEYAKIKEVMGFFRDGFDIGSNFGERPPTYFEAEIEYKHKISDIIKIAEQIVARRLSELPPSNEIFEKIAKIPEINISDVILDIESKFFEIDVLNFRQIIEDKTEKQYVIVAFLAVLMMCRDEKITIYQDGEDINIKMR